MHILEKEKNNGQFKSAESRLLCLEKIHIFFRIVKIYCHMTKSLF